MRYLHLSQSSYNRGKSRKMMNKKNINLMGNCDNNNGTHYLIIRKYTSKSPLLMSRFVCTQLCSCARVYVSAYVCGIYLLCCLPYTGFTHCSQCIIYTHIYMHMHFTSLRGFIGQYNREMTLKRESIYVYITYNIIV